MSKIINCTPHAIVYGETIFKPSGIIPRVETEESQADPIDGFVCVKQEKGEVTGLPESKPVQGGTHCHCGGEYCTACGGCGFTEYFIVSGMVFSASDRKDLIAPDTGKTAIRNEKGHIVAVTRFLRK